MMTNFTNFLPSIELPRTGSKIQNENSTRKMLVFPGGSVVAAKWWVVHEPAHGIITNRHRHVWRSKEALKSGDR